MILVALIYGAAIAVSAWASWKASYWRCEANRRGGSFRTVQRWYCLTADYCHELEAQVRSLGAEPEGHRPAGGILADKPNGRTEREYLRWCLSDGTHKWGDLDDATQASLVQFAQMDGDEDLYDAG